MRNAIKITRKEAIRMKWGKMTDSFNYKFPDVQGGISVVYAEFEGPHGKVKTKKRERIYYILHGEGEFVVENEKFDVHEGDVIAIPAKTSYDYHPTKGVLKILLVMDIWNS